MTETRTLTMPTDGVGLLTDLVGRLNSRPIWGHPARTLMLAGYRVVAWAGDGGTTLRVALRITDEIAFPAAYDARDWSAIESAVPA